MRALILGLGLVPAKFQVDGYCNLSGEIDYNQPIESCFCSSAPLAHIAAQRGNVTLLKKLKESNCALNVRNKNGNNALLFAAQSEYPYEVTKYLIEEKCDLIQRNKGNVQPIHVILSDISKASSVSQIIETLDIYRINGLSIDSLSWPVYNIDVLDYHLQVPNYFIGYSPREFLSQNNRLLEDDKSKIIDALRDPMNTIIDKISNKSRSELLQGFEAKRLSELEARQAVIDELKDELKFKNLEFLSESKKLQAALESHQNSHAETVSQFDKLKNQFEKEIDRHAAAESQFSQENLTLKRQIDTLKLDLETATSNAVLLRQQLSLDHSQEIENMKRYQDAREKSTRKEIQKLQDEVDRMAKEEISFNLNIERLSGEIESQKIEVRSCQIELDSRDEIHLEEIKSGEEKISEHLETIAGLEISNTELNSELDNQKDITSGLKEKVGALTNEKQLLLSSNEHCTTELAQCLEKP